MENWKDYLLVLTAFASIIFGFWSNLETRKANKATRKEQEESRKLQESEKQRDNQNQIALQIVERIVTIFAAVRNLRSPGFVNGITFWRITAEGYKTSAFIDERQHDYDLLLEQQLNLEIDSLRTQVILGDSTHKAIDAFQFFIQDFINELQSLKYDGHTEDEKLRKVEIFKRIFNNNPASKFNQEFMKRIKGVFTELSPFLDENLENFEHFRGYGINKK